MKKNNMIAFIVEGRSREPKFINKMKAIYFGDNNFQIITLPAEENIYMLWKELEEDNFETDIIEVVREKFQNRVNSLEGVAREDISEIYLFFDYDAQQENLPVSNGENMSDVLQKMLTSFDNETENGKLYISYPMVEALWDFKPGICGQNNSCLFPINQLGFYKKESSDRSFSTQYKKYGINEWNDIINVFVMRISCLLDEVGVISQDQYENEISPLSIYHLQEPYIQKGYTMVVSAFPEFLLDYFGSEFWSKVIKCQTLNHMDCEKQEMMS